MRKNYVSLFSSSGIGDFGFYKAGFSLIASNEIISRRMKVQLANNIAINQNAYILGDINDINVKNKIYSAINNNLKEKCSVDILVATPPCQGISVANHHKNNKDLIRNSLVLQSIIIANKIHPKIIVFENVKNFMKTACTDINGNVCTIRNVIFKHLSNNYNISYKEINFANYGANSSRPRTLVICTEKNFFGSDFNPEILMPDKQDVKTLKQVIGDLPSLNTMGEIDPNDILHSFKKYRPDMRNWIHGLKQGQNAFDNVNQSLIPHHKVKGKIVQNKQKNKDKYKRQIWDKVAPAVHTRNDIMASQNTVHPVDDRVFSIRELMRMMNIPKSFKWTPDSKNYLNNLNLKEKRNWLNKNEMNIRQSLGEAVPPIIFEQIGIKSKKAIDKYEKNRN